MAVRKLVLLPGVAFLGKGYNTRILRRTISSTSNVYHALLRGSLLLGRLSAFSPSSSGADQGERTEFPLNQIGHLLVDVNRSRCQIMACRNSLNGGRVVYITFSANSTYVGESSGAFHCLIMGLKCGHIERHKPENCKGKQVWSNELSSPWEWCLWHIGQKISSMIVPILMSVVLDRLISLRWFYNPCIFFLLPLQYSDHVYQ